MPSVLWPTLLAVGLSASCQATALPQWDCTGKKGAVAAESGICSAAGVQMLEKGGTAADAVVATVLCNGVVAPQHSGIGGGGFMLVRAPNGTYEFIDFRETAPAAAFKEMYTQNDTLSLLGGLASGVPGELRGLQHLHDNYGALCWQDLFEPAIGYARNGFPVGQDLVKYMTSTLSDGAGDFFVNDPAWAIDFAPNGTKVGLGDTMTRKRYADTLETVAKYGPDAFYTGAIANATIAALRASNGTMTVDDLKNYTVVTRDPATIDYKGWKITGTTAPSGGIVGLSILNIFSGYDVSDPAKINLTTHYLDEAMRWGYGERTNLADPAFFSNVTEFEAKMVSNETAEYIRSKISNTQTFNVSYYDPKGIEELPTPGTSHTVGADQNGLAVSLTTTVNLLFGSKVNVPETGVVMNNEMNDFSVPGSSNDFGYVPSPVNYVAPGKRPLSSISPMVVEFPNGTLYFVTGSAGGSRIITATLQSVWNVLDRGMSVHDALAAARMHDQLEPNTVSFEYPGFGTPGYDNATTAFLASLGHNVTFVAPGQSEVNALRRWTNGTFEASSDPRLHDGGAATL